MHEMFTPSAQYVAACFTVNAAIMCWGYVNILTPRFGRLRTWLLVVAVISAVCFSIGPGILTPVGRGPVVLPCFVVLVILLFRNRLSVRVSVLIVIEAFELAADVATWPVVAAVTHEDRRRLLNRYLMSPDTLYARIFYWLVLLALIGLFVFLWKRYASRVDEQVGHALLLAVSIVLFAQALFIEQISEALSAERIDPLTTFVLMCIDALGLVVLWYALAMFRDETSVQAENRALSAARARQEQYMGVLAGYGASIEDSRQALHTTATTLTELLADGTDAQIESELERVSVEGKRRTARALSNSLAVDGLAAEKISAAEQAGVVLEIPQSLELCPPLSEFDACTVLSNLLDNALASASCAEEERWIRLSLIERAGLLILTCVNPIGKAQRSSRGRRGEHGLGLFIVRDVVRQNGGTLQVETVDGVFHVILTFPCPPEAGHAKTQPSGGK